MVAARRVMFVAIPRVSATVSMRMKTPLAVIVRTAGARGWSMQTGKRSGFGPVGPGERGYLGVFAGMSACSGFSPNQPRINRLVGGAGEIRTLE